jgi:hypothetical protein
VLFDLADAQLLLDLGSTAALFAGLLWAFALHPRVGVILLLAPEALETVAPQQAPTVAFLDMTISMSDLVAGCALLVAFARLAEQRDRLGRPLGAVLVFLLLVMVSVLRGTGTFGLQTAINEARPYICFLAAAAYVATARTKRDFAAFTAVAWTVLACVYVLFAVWRWSSTGITSAGDNYVVNGQVTNGRPVAAMGALAIAQAGLLLVALRWHRLPHRALAAVLFLAVLLLQHRTVWIVSVIAVAAYLLLGRAAGGQRLSLAASTALAGVVAWFAFSHTAVGGYLDSSYETMQGRHSTFEWRLVGWRELLSEPTGLAEALLGRPFGFGFSRLIGGGVVSVSPHNWYVQSFLRIGAMGVIVLVVVYVLAFRAAHSGSRADLLARLVLLTQLVFSFAYSPFLQQGVALGLVLWHLRYAAGESGADRPAAVLPPPSPERGALRGHEPARSSASQQ